MLGREEWIAVRRLPEGGFYSGYVQNSNGRSLEIDLRPGEIAHDFSPGDLVEIKSSQTLYLGEVESCHEWLLNIGVEHAVDLETLSSIQRVWQGAVTG